MELPDIDGHVPDTDLADLDLLQESVHDLELTIPADSLREPAASDRFDTEMLRRLVGDHRDSRPGIEHEPERLFAIVDTDLDDRPIYHDFQRDRRFSFALSDIERLLLSKES